jgi:hypothetical protein
MSDPRPTTPTTELEQESPQERLEREKRPGAEELEETGVREILEGLGGAGALRNEELARQIGYAGDAEEWKRRLWRLHNEGHVKVRWVGLVDPDPVEVRLTDRGREWLANQAGSAVPAGERLSAAGTESSAPGAGGAAPTG